MCLPYKTIEPYLHYYAGRYQSRRFEHWELVNQAWITIYDLVNPKFASAGIRWAMQSYMQRQLMQDHRRNTKSVIQSIDEEIGEGLFCKNILMASKDRRLQVDEDCEYTHSLLDNPNISLADKLLIDQRYFQDLTLNQISEIHGCTRNNIIYKLKKVVSTLRYIVGVA